MNRLSGMTLFEVMVALLLLGGILFPVLLFLQSGTRNLQLSREDFQAHCATQEILQQLTAIPFDDVPLGTFGDKPGGQSRPLSDGSAMASNTQFPWRIGTNEGMYRHVEIAPWTETDGVLRAKVITVEVTVSHSTPDRPSIPVRRTVVYAKESLN
ncbi:MAG: hypothetical protein WA705_01795 [Candidatus Ozemobacteraceae bacterium]